MMLSVLRGLTLTCGSTSALGKLVPGVVPAFVEQVPYGLGPETTTSVPARTDVLKTMSAPLAIATAAIRRFMNTLLAHAHERLTPPSRRPIPHTMKTRDEPLTTLTGRRLATPTAHAPPPLLALCQPVINRSRQRSSPAAIWARESISRRRRSRSGRPVLG